LALPTGCFTGLTANSNLHEAQLNLRLLSFLGIDTAVPLPEIKKYYGFTHVPEPDGAHAALIDAQKFNLIIHPRSKGSAKEWGLDNFSKLIKILSPHKYRIFITGTVEDGREMRRFLEENRSVTDLTGQFTLSQFIAFISRCDGLLAASTGPLHIAAALNKKAIGLFSPRRPIHPGRWMPLGDKARYLVFDENCENCKSDRSCKCITQISPQQIVDLLEEK
jgi:heptosyltransferase III